MKVDYSLYLVTGRELLPSGKDYAETLEEAIKGGVTVVQLREKNTDTGEFLRIAETTLRICSKHSVPLLINDRVDIALAIGADGVHIGQSDMPIAVARRLLPPNSIIGVSCNTIQHAKQAVKDGADYIGIGAIYDTGTKKLTEKVLGPRGIAEVLVALEGTNVKAVTIGGIKSTNLLRTLHGCVTPSGLTLDGVAIVSEIFASLEPKAAATRLRKLLADWQTMRHALLTPNAIACGALETYSVTNVVQESSRLLGLLRTGNIRPLVHQITNNVVINQSVNATLALGASPIMATAPQEMEDLSKIPGGLLINFGTIADKAGMLAAGFYANLNHKPVVFDPVGVGASRHRQAAAKELLNTWQATVIKGNAAEIGHFAGSNEVLSKGVDSEGAGFKDPAAVVRLVAQKERAIVVMTGVDDYVSDGRNVVKLSNGHPLLGDITGSGCMVGTAVATLCGVASMVSGERTPGTLYSGDMFLAAISGVLAVTVASEFAAARSDVHGPGTFLPALIDELAGLDANKLIKAAKVEIL